MRKLTYTATFGGDYCEVSIDLLEEEAERILGIKIDTLPTLYLRNDDINELHNKIHECLEAHAEFSKLAAAGMSGWNEHADAEPVLSMAALDLLAELGHDETLHYKAVTSTPYFVDIVGDVSARSGFAFLDLLDKKLIDVSVKVDAEGVVQYAITDEGRVALDAQGA